jgi:hypothetical protein
MVTFAETEIVDYRLSFADQGQNSIFRFRLQQTNGALPFSFSVCSKQKLPFSITSVFRLRNSGNMETWNANMGES